MNPCSRSRPGPLAGVPFGVKNLYRHRRADNHRRLENPPRCSARRGGCNGCSRALDRAGAVLCGALNMDEFAYGFVTENAHDGPTRNPRDLSRIAGGSSGGSAAAVADGLLPLTLGTDTNGSIRVPASLCGVFGLKPTYGRLSRAGVFPFVGSLDHIGPFARSVRDLALVFDLLQGYDPRDPVCTRRAAVPALPNLGQGTAGLRVAVLGGHFAAGADPVALAAVEEAARVLGATRRVTLPGAELARSAAYLITAAEGGQLHLPNLRTRAQDFDPATRDRLLAGALLPAAWYLQAQRFRVVVPRTGGGGVCRDGGTGRRHRHPARARDSLPGHGDWSDDGPHRRTSKCRCAPTSDFSRSRFPSSGCPWRACRRGHPGRLARGCPSVSRSSRLLTAKVKRCASPPSLSPAGLATAPSAFSKSR